MILLDTSFIISFFNENDVFHEKAVKSLREYEKQNKRFAVSNYIINEALTVILRKRSLKSAKDLLDFLLNYKRLEIFHVDDKGFFKIIELFKNQKNGLSFTDCSLIWMAKDYGFTVATFDKQLLNILKELKFTKYF